MIDDKRFQTFQEACKTSGVSPDKPLYTALATVMETALIAQDIAKGGARGITPEGEADLIARVTKAVDGAMKDHAKRNRLGLQWLTSCLVGGAVAFSLLVGLGIGHWWGWSGGRASVVATAGRLQAAASLSGPDGAEIWLGWMLNNNAVEAKVGCAGASVWVVDGREACAVNLWQGPPSMGPVAKR